MTLKGTTCDTASVAAARKVTFGYDAMNRLQTTTYADGSPAIGRTFTADGLPSTVSSGGVVWTTSYDNRRNNTGESMAYGGATYNVGRIFARQRTDALWHRPVQAHCTANSTAASVARGCTTSTSAGVFARWLVEHQLAAPSRAGIAPNLSDF